LNSSGTVFISSVLVFNPSGTVFTSSALVFIYYVYLDLVNFCLDDLRFNTVQLISFFSNF